MAQESSALPAHQSAVRRRKQQQPSQSQDSEQRQRRSRMIREQANDARDFRLLQSQVQSSQSSSSGVIFKFYCVVATAIMVSLLAGLHHLKPSFLYGKRKRARSSMNIGNTTIDPKSPFQPDKDFNYALGTLYPASVVMERDLPLWFRSFAMATPSNLMAREAAQRVISMRKRVHGEPTVTTKLRAWDDWHVRQRLLTRPDPGENQMCGQEFVNKYQIATQQVQLRNADIKSDSRIQDPDFDKFSQADWEGRRQDLLHWCSIALRLVDGFVVTTSTTLGSSVGTVDIVNPAFRLARGRGMMVVTKAADAQNDVRGRMSSAYVLLPQETFAKQLPNDNRLSQYPPGSHLASHMLTWLLANDMGHFESSTEYRQMFEEFLYEVAVTEGKQVHNSENGMNDDYMMLNTSCQKFDTTILTAKKSKRMYADRTFARHCTESGSLGSVQCCDYVVPESEGGRIGYTSRRVVNDDDDDNVSSKSSSSNTHDSKGQEMGKTLRRRY